MFQGLVDLIADTGTPEFLPLLQQWNDANLLDTQHARIDFYEEQIRRPLQERADEKIVRDGRGYVRNAADCLRHWPCFNKLSPARMKSTIVPALPPVQTIVNPQKIGRNDPCPCGSGKKYKKCCAP